MVHSYKLMAIDGYIISFKMGLLFERLVYGFCSNTDSVIGPSP